MPRPPSSSDADPSKPFGDLPPRTALDAARDELRADTRRGAAGRAVLERYSARIDALVRRLYDASGLARTSSAVLALTKQLVSLFKGNYKNSITLYLPFFFYLLNLIHF
jgi:hypothetical protein